MAEIQIEQQHPEREEATLLEIVLWIIGILMIPMVPILMVVFLTPYSGI